MILTPKMLMQLMRFCLMKLILHHPFRKCFRDNFQRMSALAISYHHTLHKTINAKLIFHQVELIIELGSFFVNIQTIYQLRRQILYLNNSINSSSIILFMAFQLISRKIAHNQQHTGILKAHNQQHTEMLRVISLHIGMGKRIAIITAII